MKPRRFLNGTYLRYLNLLCLIVLISSFSYAKGPQSPLVVNIESMQFNSKDLTVSANQKVKWINNDLVPHTVTADAGTFDSKSIAPGKSWSFKFKKKGNFPYRCQFHPSMLGSIEVK